MGQETGWMDLLRLCLVDLRNGETALQQRVGGVAEQVNDADLGKIFQSAERSAVRDESALGNAISSLGMDPKGSENLWMKGILDDMERDTRTIAAGVTLDVALIGALRKALAAAIVSYDTAIAVAGRAGKEQTREALEEIRSDKARQDEALAEALRRLTGR